ncbi:hypothetical protein ACQEVS_12955 [Streptomyces sp. CA-181903]|uniref:hypothetical protein n=1 Tax=Streptomyces sp. CA-181903 TaxID=3240055 RepID=UPI003D944265
MRLRTRLLMMLMMRHGLVGHRLLDAGLLDTGLLDTGLMLPSGLVLRPPACRPPWG